MEVIIVRQEDASQWSFTRSGTNRSCAWCTTEHQHRGQRGSVEEEHDRRILHDKCIDEGAIEQRSGRAPGQQCIHGEERSIRVVQGQAPTGKKSHTTRAGRRTIEIEAELERDSDKLGYVAREREVCGGICGTVKGEGSLEELLAEKRRMGALRKRRYDCDDCNWMTKLDVWILWPKKRAQN